MSFAIFTFDCPKILKSNIHCEDDLEYTTSTVNKPSSRSRQTTSLLAPRPPGTPNGPAAIIDWAQGTFEVAGRTRRIDELCAKRGTFSSSRYWTWLTAEEYRVKYEAETAHTWTVYAYDGTVLATLTTRIHYFFHDDSLPLLEISPSVTDDRELQFIILILLYSETKRRDRSLKKRIGANFAKRRC
ncbi:hypothetical protein B0H14DRAFT_2683937 [Mycena olivaceomarginata]|nr:hypothetical protein B0H14DRAFT_2683937 [Mycena olivaceomarginata]